MTSATAKAIFNPEDFRTFTWSGELRNFTSGSAVQLESWVPLEFSNEGALLEIPRIPMSQASVGHLLEGVLHVQVGDAKRSLPFTAKVIEIKQLPSLDQVRIQWVQVKEEDRRYFFILIERRQAEIVQYFKRLRDE